MPFCVMTPSVRPQWFSLAETLSFLPNPRYQPQLAQTRAACVIVATAFRDAATARGAAIVAADPYLCFARLTQWWARQTRPAVAAGTHPSAVVDPIPRGLSISRTP